MQAEEREMMESTYIIAIAVALTLFAFLTIGGGDDDDWRGHA